MINQRIDASTDQTQLLVQLLLGSGMLTRDEMSEFRTIAQDLRLPLSQTLSNSGRFSKETLEKCSDAMNRIQSKQISLDLAIRALRVAVQKKLPFNEAIESAKSLHRTTLTVVSAANELTSLLMDVRILTQEQLGQLLKSQSGSALMIGQQMVLENIISIEALLQALHALVLIRSGGLSKPNAIDGLKYAYENRVSIEQALFELDTFVQPDAKELRIGELYFFAGLISLDQYVECLEIEMFKKKEFGQILVERGLTRQETLASALEFLSAVANNLLKPHEAAELLVAAGRNMRPAYALIAECQRARQAEPNCKLGDLLVDASVCKREAIEQIIVGNPDSAVKVGSKLLKSGLISEKILYSALRLQTCLRLGYLSRAKSLEILSYCMQNNVSLDQSLREKQVNVPSRMQWQWI